jgi:CheY-like chemotaxis protein
MDVFMKFLALFLSFLQTIIWPMTVLLIAFYLRIPIKRFIGEIIEVSLRAGPIETTAKSKQALEIATSLAAASAHLEDSTTSTTQGLMQETPRDIAKLVDQTVNPQVAQHLAGTSILWVDDKPLNNTYVRNALEALGLRFAICTSTEDAVEELKRSTFDAIISDMGRPPDEYAGYTLLDEMHKLSFKLPYIIYARGANRPNYKEEAKAKGAYASVSGPQTLYRTVVTLFSTTNANNPTERKNDGQVD